MKNILHLPRNLFEGVGADVPVNGTSDYYVLPRDGDLPEFEAGDFTESEWLQQHTGRPVIEAFNNIHTDPLQNKRLPHHMRDRLSVPVAGDDAADEQKVIVLVEGLGSTRWGMGVFTSQAYDSSSASLTLSSTTRSTVLYQVGPRSLRARILPSR